MHQSLYIVPPKINAILTFQVILTEHTLRYQINKTPNKKLSLFGMVLHFLQYKTCKDVVQKEKKKAWGNVGL